ncbi:MFS domain-containing protein [Favolaschia claudopus]|uniref:MFS domain-containing protein n=1 Tax=Favolaschia claudopus TaxID=2862362 RepID=A0AAW0ABS7_9AGAR
MNVPAKLRRTPIPRFQLFILIFIQFAEPMTALVIYPFVVQFVRETGITGGDETKVGFYAGLLESSFFFAEALTVYQFGRLSDIYGRRPVLLMAPLGVGLAMIGFGLSRSFWVLLAFRCAQGAFNGNLGVAKTVMTEISDPTNVAEIFSYLQLMWSVGSTTSPFMGGFLANAAVKWPDTLGKIKILRLHPYFLPCAVAGGVALAGFGFAVVGLRETLPSLKERNKNEQFGSPPTETDPLLSAGSGSLNPTSDHLDSDLNFDAEVEAIPSFWELFTPKVRIALLNHACLCFCDMAYDALIPLVYSTPVSLGGLGLRPHDIGVIMGSCGIFNAIIQVVFGGRVIRYFGARRIFTYAFIAYIGVFATYPLLSILARRAGHVDAAVIVVLVCQLSSSCMMYFSFAATMLFIMDSAPNRRSIGSVTGLSQMVGTVFRGIAPSVASSLFAVSVKHNIAGGYLVYIILACISYGALRCTLMLPRRLSSDAESRDKN